MHQITDLNDKSLYAPRSCNKNCRQGRACDCVPAVEEAEQAAPMVIWPWLTLRRFLTAYIVAIAGALIYVHGYFFGWFA